MHIVLAYWVVATAVLALVMAAAYVMAFHPLAPRPRVTVIEAKDAMPEREEHMWRRGASAPLVQARRWHR